MHRLAEGDAGAFDALFHANWDHVFSAALIITKSHQLADDIAQDAFLALWKDRSKMAVIENLKGFLHTSVRFLALKRLRRLKVEDSYVRYLAGRVAPQPVAAEQENSVTFKELQDSLHRGIELLPPQQQRAFRLSREQGLTHEQIGEMMGIGKKTVKDYIVRSIAFLRPYLNEYGSLILAFAFFF